MKILPITIINVGRGKSGQGHESKNYSDSNIKLKE